jgi:hypothetical protein
MTRSEFARAHPGAKWFTFSRDSKVFLIVDSAGEAWLHCAEHPAIADGQRIKGFKPSVLRSLIPVDLEREGVFLEC